MIFESIVDVEGRRACFVDGYPVPEKVYDTLLPAKLFPVETGLTREEAEAKLAAIKAAAPAPEPHKGPYFNLSINGAKPLKSDALAVHPKQIKQAKERNKRQGLNVDYDRHGRPIFTDAGQRRKLMKIEGVRQMNSYYGA